MNRHIIILYTFLVLLKETQGGYQWTSWSRPSSCSVTCGRGIISRTRECKPTDDDADNNSTDDDNDDGDDDGDGSYCKGHATIEEACYLLPCKSKGSPSSTCNCGCKLTSSEGFISSIHMQNTNVLCPWYIETKPGSSIILTIKKAENFDWTKGGIFVAEKHKSHMFTAQYGERMLHSFPIVIKSESNQLNVTLHYNKAPNKDQTFAVEVSYASYNAPVSHSNEEKGGGGFTQNIPAIAGIAACALIIVIAAIVVVCRRTHQNDDVDKDEMENPEEGFEDNCSTISGSQKSTKLKQPVNMNLMSGHGYPVSPLSSGYPGEDRATLLQAPYANGTLPSHGYPEGNDIFVQAVPTTYIQGQSYNNWPVQTAQNEQPLNIQQLPQAAIDFMINQAQLNFARQISLDHSKAGSSYYPTSEGEG